MHADLGHAAATRAAGIAGTTWEARIPATWKEASVESSSRRTALGTGDVHGASAPATEGGATVEGEAARATLAGIGIEQRSTDT
jgi:hypothetical protein